MERGLRKTVMVDERKGTRRNGLEVLEMKAVKRVEQPSVREGWTLWQ
jgi:hypothetical protein